MRKMEAIGLTVTILFTLLIVGVAMITNGVAPW